MSTDLTDLNQLDLVDWPLLNSRNSKHDPDDPGKKERYQAEAVVWKCVPINALLGIGSYTKAVNSWIQGQLDQRGLTAKCSVQANWYFP